MYKIIFNNINSTFDNIYSDENFFELINKNKLAIQSFQQKKGVGRGSKKWLSPKGNLYLTLNQRIDSSNILKSNLYICYLVHKYFKKKYSIELKYKWPNDLYFKSKKIVGVVSKSKIISKYAYIQTGLGINLNYSPIKTSISLSKIILKQVSVFQFSRDLLNFFDKNLDITISNINLINYLNTYLMNSFKLKHPIYKKGTIEIIKLDKDLSLLLKHNNEYKKIFFGELL